MDVYHFYSTLKENFLYVMCDAILTNKRPTRKSYEFSQTVDAISKTDFNGLKNASNKKLN